jgi:endonuclease/exonuclease/phosphatase family metal-dependent hydrolase
MSLKIQMITMNIHKGFSSFDQSFVLHQLKESLREVSSDLVFLQEVQGEHQKHAGKHPNWPENSQYEFLADQIWNDFAYAKNAVYPHGHHGNAILSKYPITQSRQTDLSVSRWEKRGLLHCSIVLPASQQEIHALCVHLDLFERGRKTQYKMLVDYIQSEIPPEAPIILAGDFNDWSQNAKMHFVKEFGLHEVFEKTEGRPAKTFPSILPLLSLDRIYTRGLEATQVKVLKGKPWKDLSDHAALWAELEVIAK